MKSDKFAVGRSATERTFQQLRADILACHLYPGSKLKILELQNKLGVSPGAIRESLSRLTSEGLVVAEAQRGFFVAPISDELLRDTYAARVDIEAAALTHSITSGDVEWEGNLVGAFHRLEHTPEPLHSVTDTSADVWFSAHDNFHFSLVAACTVKSLLRLRVQLVEQTERYRRLATPLGRGIRDTGKEHKAICDAAVSRNAALCIRLMKEHLEKTTEVLCASLAAFAKDAGLKAEKSAQNPRPRGHMSRPERPRAMPLRRLRKRSS